MKISKLSLYNVLILYYLKITSRARGYAAWWQCWPSQRASAPAPRTLWPRDSRRVLLPLQHGLQLLLLPRDLLTLLSVHTKDSSLNVNHDHYNSTWAILIKWIRVILSGDILTQIIPKKAYFLFVPRTKKNHRKGRRLKFCGNYALARFSFHFWV